MGTVIDWRRISGFFDRVWVEWGMFVVGIILIIIGIIISPLPGPGGVFFIIPGIALVLRTSMWARRRYVRFKKWQPKVGRFTDKALRRESARRREELRKARRARQEAQKPQLGD